MKNIRTLITLCLFLAATHAFAQLESKPLIKVKVPFQFTVANHTFPAGEYLISTVQPERTIQIAGNGAKASIQAVSPFYAAHPSENSRLVFHRYGDAYFLEEVWSAGQDVARTLPQSKHELEMAKAGVTPQIATVQGASSGR